MSKCVDDFRFQLGESELVPIMIGGMGVNISTAELAFQAAKLGGVGHISDAMVPTVTDRKFDTSYVSEKLKQYKSNTTSLDKHIVRFDLNRLAEATKLYVSKTMESKRGLGMIFINIMEKLSMNAPKETLKVRMQAALDAGIDGITLSAGLHLGSFSLIEDHPRFRDAKLGIIVSSVRALKIFLKKTISRLPDYIIVEGPLAGGHLGFSLDDWKKHDLRSIFSEIKDWLREQKLSIPLIPAGGIFTGTDAADYLEIGASAVQVATRFTVTRECGLPEKVKQNYFSAQEEDVIVNTISPTGYPMRMLRSSPSIGANIRPNCEAYGYLLDANGRCAYVDAYEKALSESKNPKKIRPIQEKTCLCTHMRNYDCWTCGHTVFKLKDTTTKDEQGHYHLLPAEHVFNDYRYSKDHQILLPEQG